MKVLVVYYSMYGHVYRMAQAVAKGASEVEGAEVMLRRTEELEVVKQRAQSDEYIRKAMDTQKDVPVCTLDDLRQCDAVLFGSPTRFGNMTAQMKQLFDGMGSLWVKGEMEGKPAGAFTSTASTHGGQETTIFTMYAPMIHLGMIIVGIPYSTEGLAHTEARGASPYGASTIAGPTGELQPTPDDLRFAEVQGRRVAEIAKKLRG
jgi:NAD(P)H dehydrogenase (quinone)